LDRAIDLSHKILRMHQEPDQASSVGFGDQALHDRNQHIGKQLQTTEKPDGVQQTASACLQSSPVISDRPRWHEVKLGIEQAL
jgi:hypothetical protein